MEQTISRKNRNENIREHYQHLTFSYISDPLCLVNVHTPGFQEKYLGPSDRNAREFDLRSQFFRKVGSLYLGHRESLKEDGEYSDEALHEHDQRHYAIREVIAEQNTRLITKMVRNMRRGNEYWCDLMSSGGEGLMYAIDRLDPWRIRNKCSTYLCRGIQFEIQHDRKKRRRILRFENVSFDPQFDSPTIDYLFSDDRERFLELLPKVLEKADLNELERTVLDRRFYSGDTLEEIRPYIGWKTKERVRQIQNDALRKLHRLLVAQ